jgi:hypothetical protein
MSRLCPGCNLPARPVRVWAASITGVAGVVGVCGRCAASLNTNAPGHAKKRLSAACGKALARPDRYWAEPFETFDHARVACGLLGTALRSETLVMLGWA